MQVFNVNQFLERQIVLDNVELFKLFDLAIPKPQKNGPWIAGGAIRRTLCNEPLVTDIDYFYKDGEELSFNMKVLLEKLAKENGGRIKSTTVETNATTYDVEYKANDEKEECTKSIKVQEILIDSYRSPEHLIDEFDFTICQFAYDGDKLYCGDHSLWDLARKRLVINKITYPVASMRRLIKYTQQGYYACHGTMNQFLETIVKHPELLHNTADISSLD